MTQVHKPDEITYHKNGKPAERREYNNMDISHPSAVTIYNENGTPTKRTHYREGGTLESETSYDENGKPTETIWYEADGTKRISNKFDKDGYPIRPFSIGIPKLKPKTKPTHSGDVWAENWERRFEKDKKGLKEILRQQENKDGEKKPLNPALVKSNGRS